MKVYVGSKIIGAKPMTYGDYHYKAQGRADAIDSERATMEGYMVFYPSPNAGEPPHKSWSPKDVFELCYRELTKEESLMAGFSNEERGLPPLKYKSEG